jgi:hypothetical protein
VRQKAIDPKATTPTNSTHPLRLRGRTSSEGMNVINASTTAEEAGSPSVELFDISHLKWPNMTTPAIRKNLCQGAQPTGLGKQMSTVTKELSTVIKEFNLSGWVMYCDGWTATTKTTGWKAQKGKSGGAGGSGWSAAALYQSDSDDGFLKPETEPEREPETDPDVLSIIVNGLGPVIDDSVWESDVGPIDPKDFDESVGKRGAGKDWIGPQGFAMEEAPEARIATTFVA